MRRITIVLAALTLLCFAAIDAPAQAASSQPVVLVHGWLGNPLIWSGMKADLERRGFKVYALQLPYLGLRAGDTERNAEFVKWYITSHDLHNVILGGHSLGGTLVEYYVRELDTGEIAARFTLDSNIHTAGDKGIVCWLVPDQCAGSEVRNEIFSANPRSDLFFLDVARGHTPLPQVDCYVQLPYTDHIFFPEYFRVRATVLQLAEGQNPCDRSPV